MTDLTALRAAIVAAPDDDGPRRVYADALIHRGDARGELIALYCDPRLDADLRDRKTRALWQRHGDTWRADDFGAAPGLAGISYARGFAHSAQLSLADFAALAPGLAVAPLRELEVSALGSDLGPLFRSAVVRRVRKLALSYGLENASADEIGRVLAAAEAVDELVLSPQVDVPQVWAALERWPRLAQLKRLSLWCLPLNAERARWLGGACSALESLHADRCFDDASLTALAAAARFRLRSLDLSDHDGLYGRTARLSDGALAATLGSGLAEGLVHLSLFGCHPREAVAEALPRLRCSGQLETLDLGSIGRPDAVRALAHCELPRLARLSVRHAGVGDRDVEAFAHFPTVKHLSAEKNALTGAGASALIDRFPALESLQLADCPTGTKGAMAIAWSANAKSLRMLGLSYTGAGPDAAEAIATSGNLNALRVLNASWNEGKKAFVVALAGAPFEAMARLSVGGNMRGSSGPLFEDGWLVRGEEIYERRLELDGSVVPRKKRAAKAAGPPADVKPFDASGSHRVGDWVTFEEHGPGVVTAVEPLHVEVKFKLVRLKLGLQTVGAQPYDIRKTYAVGEVIAHPTLGAGTVVKATADRIEVEFGAFGSKKLVHAKK